MSTDASWARNFLESSRTVWVISAVILCLFALTNLPWQLDDYDQAQQAIKRLHGSNCAELFGIWEAE